MTFIQQDAILFSGSLRSNLDPFGEHADEALRAALERVDGIHAELQHLFPADLACGAGAAEPLRDDARVIGSIFDGSTRTKVTLAAATPDTPPEASVFLVCGGSMLPCFTHVGQHAVLSNRNRTVKVKKVTGLV